MQTTHEKLAFAIDQESRRFKECYLWIEQAMPQEFFKEVTQDNLLLVTHSLMGFELQDYYSTINLKGAAIILCLDVPDADLKILQNYSSHGIKNYQTFVSNSPPPFSGSPLHLRIATIVFTDVEETQEKPLSQETKEKVRSLVLKENPEIQEEEFNGLLTELGGRFLNALPLENLIMALNMYFRAKTRDSCQYEVRVNENWKQNNQASMQIVLAWKNTPKFNFLYRLARTIHRHKLVMRRVDATYVNPYAPSSILLMTLDLHGQDGRSVGENACIPEFLRELITVKYFASFDALDEHLVSKGLISGNFANVLRAIQSFVHQALVHLDPNLYSIENITEGLYRHPELTIKLQEAFTWKFHPELHDDKKYLAAREAYLKMLERLDTGQEEYDIRRKNVLFQAMNMVHHTLKTNAYRMNFTALSFRLDPHYLDEIPFERLKKFPELPFAIFYMKGMHFFGFHIRFKDLARGGLRTVFPEQKERMLVERNTVFTECYNLSYTQHLKNKDIPEGGAKGIIFLKPFERLGLETDAYKKELIKSHLSDEEIDNKTALFKQEQTLEYLHQSQRSFVENLVMLVNCHPDGTLKVRGIVDYWKKPEYLYLGPDENMHDAMIQWIADFSKKYNYKPGSSFISSKPKVGINHKEYGVTSLGVNVYLEEFLKYIGIDPKKDVFTVKMAGGPDGDVAGNQIFNFYKYYPETAKLLSLTDISGTVHDPRGLDLKALADLFKRGKPISYYPPEKLNTGGFLINKNLKKETSAISQKCALWKMEETLVQEWISANEVNHMLRDNIYKTKTDVFIPAGGRPRSLNETNIKDFLDSTGKPTAKIIIEGANLYLTAGARRELEKLGTLIVRDSSANKTGVICSSFEVLAGLALGDEAFYTHKEILVKEILERLKALAYKEAFLMIQEHRKTEAYLTDISAKISERINLFTYQLLAFLESSGPLSKDPTSSLMQMYLNYCPPFLRLHYEKALLNEIPEPHQKAIIACHVGAELVYQNGLSWFPSIVDILPLVLKNLPNKLST